jgi:hypothetical protein
LAGISRYWFVARFSWRVVNPNPCHPMKQFIISVVVVFIVSMALDFVIHAVLLKEDYAKQPALMRPEAEANRHFPVLVIAHVILAAGVTAIYRRGREAGKSWLGQGFRFGVWFAVASCIPGFLIYYAVQPLDHTLVLKQLVLGTIATVLVGLAAAALNKSPA